MTVTEPATLDFKVAIFHSPSSAARRSALPSMKCQA